jgi:hypothetical protein
MIAATAPARVWTPSFSYAFSRCLRTVPGEERNYLRCQRCGKEKWRTSSLGPSGEHTGEGSIKTFGRGFGRS